MSDKDDNLSEYHEKRDLRKSPEPSGSESGSGDHPVFVIQKHDASNLHYDFRLEVEGVLKSWAVPKGPSTDPSEKRLALPTEDHPLEYADFEGVIPEDQYGGGTVMVWDRGPYHNLKDDKSVAEAYDDGELTVYLEGEKLQGGYALIRTGSGEDARWLLIKMDDDAADARRNPTSTEPDSVISGRTLEEIAEEEKEEEE
jgi:DNA ligase D-like protein (predicted 3'-phosphoesterase)